MAKKAFTAAEDEIVFSPDGDAEPSPEVQAAISNQEAQKAPTDDQLIAYWTPGRTPMEAQIMLQQHITQCSNCERWLPYIPVAGQDVPKLVCNNC